MAQSFDFASSNRQSIGRCIATYVTGRVIPLARDKQICFLAEELRKQVRRCKTQPTPTLPADAKGTAARVFSSRTAPLLLNKRWLSQCAISSEYALAELPAITIAFAHLHNDVMP